MRNYIIIPLGDEMQRDKGKLVTGIFDLELMGGI